MITKGIGIFRETAHSPARETDDRQILEWTARNLSRGYGGINLIKLVRPEEESFVESFTEFSTPALFLLMCEKKETLAFIEGRAAPNSLFINSFEGIRNTYRQRLVEILKNSTLPIPRSYIIPTGSFYFPRSYFNGEKAFWVKRGDFHNVQEGDVDFTRTHADLLDKVMGMKMRKISEVIVQENIEGDLVKFYGIGPDKWFKWFYPKNQEVRKFTFMPDDLKEMAAAAAVATELEVFGGDAVVTEKGEIFLIDLNAWPSFGPFKEEASSEIAKFVAEKISSHNLLNVPVETGKNYERNRPWNYPNQ